MEKKIRNILFDLDGTLSDTAPDIIKSLKKAYEPFTKHKSVKIEKIIIGPPIKEIAEKLTPGLKEAELDEITKNFREYYDNDNLSKTKLFAGVKRVLFYLKEGQYKVFVVTNKPFVATDRVLKKLGIKHFFKAIVTSDILKGKRLNKSEMIEFLLEKEGLDPKETIMVGDTAQDIKSAKKNGLLSIGIKDGYGSENELIDAEPDYLVEKIDELIKIFQHN